MMMTLIKTRIFNHKDMNHRGGGIAIFIKDSLCYKQIGMILALILKQLNLLRSNSLTVSKKISSM